MKALTTFAVTWLLMASAAIAAPAVTLDPISVAPGGKVTVGANGLSPDDVTVAVLLDGKVLRRFRVSGGVLPGKAIAVPATTKVGNHTIVVRGEKTRASAEQPLAVTYDWPQPRMDAGQTNVSPDKSFDPGKLVTFTAEASVPVGPVVGNPIVFARRIIFTNPAGEVVAFEVGTWKKLWSRQVLATLTPVAFQNRIFVATSNGRLVALDPRDGRDLGAYSFPVSSRVGQPVAYGNSIYVQASDGLYAIAPVSMRKRWKNLDAPFRGGSMVVASSFGLMAASNYVDYAIDPKTGKLLGSYDGDGRIFYLGDRVYFRERIAVGTYDKSVLGSIDAKASGYLKFEEAGGPGLYGFPTIFDKSIFVQQQYVAGGVRTVEYGAGGVHVDPTASTAQATACINLILAQQTIFCVASDASSTKDTLYAYKLRGGKLAEFGFTTQASEPVLSDGRIYLVVGEDLKVMGLPPASQ